MNTSFRHSSDSFTLEEKMKKIILILILLILIPTQLFAEAYFAAKKEMVERAEVIAIIEILNTEKS